MAHAEALAERIGGADQAEATEMDATLRSWVDHCLAYNGTLPAK